MWSSDKQELALGQVYQAWKSAPNKCFCSEDLTATNSSSAPIMDFRKNAPNNHFNYFFTVGKAIKFKYLKNVSRRTRNIELKHRKIQ
jgi:hypothetical protein